MLKPQEDHNKEMQERILLEFFQATNLRDFSYIPKLYAPHAEIHTLSGKQYGAEPILNIFQYWIYSFPDFQLEPLAINSEEDVVVVHWKGTGTFVHPLRNIQPTGKKITLHGLTCFKCLQNEIIEHWARVDYHPLRANKELP